MSDNITIKDIAKKADVSVATVSRVLNGLDGFSEETRKRVMRVVNEYGYRRNAVARNLKIKKSNTIAALFPKAETVYYINIVNGIEDMARRFGYMVIICHTGVSGNRTKEFMEMLRDRQVDGIIGCSLPPNEGIDTLMVNSGIPSVLVSTLSYHYPIPYVKIDDFQAEYAATEYLIKKGHRDIVFLSGSMDDAIAGRPRFNGYKKALIDHGIPYRDDFVAYTSFSYESGVRAIEKIFKNQIKFTAIVTCSDEVAIAALSVAHKNGLTAPDDFSVVGFDGTHMAEMTIPTLTTVTQPFYKMGTVSFEMLLERMEKGRIPENQILPFEIVERKSVKNFDSSFLQTESLI